jgi:hypothetical protein
LVPPFEIGVEIFETEREENSGHKGDCYGSSAIGFGVIAHRHHVIVIRPSLHSLGRCESHIFKVSGTFLKLAIYSGQKLGPPLLILTRVSTSAQTQTPFYGLPNHLTVVQAAIYTSALPGITLAFCTAVSNTPCAEDAGQMFGGQERRKDGQERESLAAKDRSVPAGYVRGV